jgi:hypothetical protein
MPASIALTLVARAVLTGDRVAEQAEVAAHLGGELARVLPGVAPGPFLPFAKSFASSLPALIPSRTVSRMSPRAVRRDVLEVALEVVDGGGDADAGHQEISTTSSRRAVAYAFAGALHTR